MHHEDIKAAIRKKGVTPADIARHLVVSPSAVTAVIKGKSQSEDIRAAIARVTGLSTSELWPVTAAAASGTETIKTLLKGLPRRQRAAA